MQTVVTRSTVAGDGSLTLALGPGMAGRAVRVTVEPEAPAMTQEEWRAAILATAGCWQGEFERGPQGEYEERDPL